MKSNVSAEVTISLSQNDLEHLLEDGELSADGVTLTFYGEGKDL